MSDADDELLLRLDRESHRRTERVRVVLLEAGRPDLVVELDTKLREIRTGVAGARSTWHSISPAQRRVLQLLSSGRWLVRQKHSKTRYDAHGEPHAEGNVCSLATFRNLTTRDLLACDGTAFDPELRGVLTEHGRFVLVHGPLPA